MLVIFSGIASYYGDNYILQTALLCMYKSLHVVEVHDKKKILVFPVIPLSLSSVVIVTNHVYEENIQIVHKRTAAPICTHVCNYENWPSQLFLPQYMYCDLIPGRIQHSFLHMLCKFCDELVFRMLREA